MTNRKKSLTGLRQTSDHRFNAEHSVLDVRRSAARRMLAVVGVPLLVIMISVFGLGGIASAHVVTSITADCYQVTAHFSDFPDTGVVVHIAADVNGQTVGSDVLVTSATIRSECRHLHRDRSAGRHTCTHRRRCDMDPLGSTARARDPHRDVRKPDHHHTRNDSHHPGSATTTTAAPLTTTTEVTTTTTGRRPRRVPWCTEQRRSRRRPSRRQRRPKPSARRAAPHHRPRRRPSDPSRCLEPAPTRRSH